MKTFLIVIILWIISSCTNTKTTLLIINSETVNEIDSIIVRTHGLTERFEKVNVTPQTRRIILKSSQKKEGGFTLVVFQKDSIINSGSFGYFVNENEIKPKYKIKILKDYSIKEETEK